MVLLAYDTIPLDNVCMEVIKINDKQMMFCTEYLKDFDPEAAAERAGYSDKNAAWRLLKRDDIQKQLVISNRERSCDIASQDEILRFYTAIMRREMVDDILLQNKEKMTRIDEDGNKVNVEKIIVSTSPQRVKLSEAISAADKLHRYYTSRQEEKDDNNSGIVILPEIKTEK